MFRNITRADFRFLIALLVTHAVFFLIALYYQKIYNGDSYEYIYMALNIKDHFWFYSGNPALPITEEYMTLRTPGYPLFLLLVYLFSINNWVVLVLQNLISIFNIYYMRNTMRNIGYSRKYDWVMIAFVALFPSQFINANIIAPDILLQTSVLIYFRHFIFLIKEQKLRHAFYMSFALVLGFMFKPVLYPFALAHCLLMLWFAFKYRKGLMRSFIAGIIPVLILLSYGAVNKYRTGKFHFSSIQSFNAIFYYFNYFSDTASAAEATAFLEEERAKMKEMPVFADRYEYANQRGLELLRQNFGPYMWYHLKNSGRLFIDPGKGELDLFTGRLTLSTLYDTDNELGFFDTYRKYGLSGLDEYFERNPSLPIVLIVLLFNVIRLFGLFLFLFNRHINLYIRLFTVILLTYFAITTGPIANTRYFIPVFLIVTGCSATGYRYLLHWWKYRTIITT